MENSIRTKTTRTIILHVASDDSVVFSFFSSFLLEIVVAVIVGFPEIYIHSEKKS
jgi:hypothetical protein